MTFEEIQEAADAIVLMMTEKGIVTPRADLNVRSNATPIVVLRNGSESPVTVGSYGITIIAGDTPQAALENARAFILAMPDPVESIAREFNKRVASAADFGRENGIDDEYVTPLRGVMQAVSKNLLPNMEAE